MLKRYFLIGVPIVIFIFGIIFLMFRQSAPQPENLPKSKNYSNTEYGISFLYPDTYVLKEIDAPGSGLRKHHVITLIHKEDLPLPINGEGPPSITIDIYQNNLDKQKTEEWIRNSSASNFKLGEGRLASVTVGGLPALSYRWSGLYEGTTIALAQPNWIYALTVTYLEMGSQIIQDFVTIRNSIQISNP